MRWAGIGLCCLLLCTAGCQRDASHPANTVRLTTLKPDSIEGRSESTAPLHRTEWRFDAPPSPLPEQASVTFGWEAGPGVSALEIKDGKLTGKSATDTPLLQIARTTASQDLDTLQSIEIRCRVSSGSNLRIGFDEGEKLDPAKVLGYLHDFPEFFNTTPILAGDEFHTYSLRPVWPTTSSKIRHVIVLPSDKAGAAFEIESVRLIFRKEYLAGIPSGVSWQGLGGIYHETLVSRSPETIRIKTKLAAKPWLDVSVGTVEDGPVTFQVSLRDATNAKEEILLKRTVTRPHRWEPVPIDLSRYAGHDVRFSFAVAADDAGRLGFWGSPAVRNQEPIPSADRASGVILIWADTLRRDHLDVYGYKRATAPHIRQMASEGTLFQNCVSQATWTKVASPSLISSLYPTTHGVRNYADRLPSAATTLAEVFQNAGFATIDYSSNEFTATFSNFHQGFDELHEDSSLPDHHSSKTSRDYVDRLLPWLQSHRNVPFFVFLHIYDAHDPYEPNAPYNTLWADPSGKKEHDQQLDKARKNISDPLMKLFGMPNREEMIQAGLDPQAFISYEEDWYDGSIRGMDAEIGRLFELLRNSGLDRKTLVVLAGDHGEEFLDHGRVFHGQSVYGELTNVPLIFWKPGMIHGGTAIKDTVETIDVMPTILEFCGLKPPAGIQGQSLKPLFSMGAGWSRPAFSEKAKTTGNGAPAPRDTESFAVVQGDWKLIHNIARHPGEPEYELYDLSKDGLNKNNLAGQHADVVRDLSKQLNDWYAKTTAARLKPDSQAASTLNQEELDRLRSLGYIQ